MIDVTPAIPILPRTYAYRHAHYIVKKLRGRATSCIFGCPGPLFEWANLTGDYNDPNDFAPMCRFCNRRYDYTRRSMEPGFTGHHGMRRIFKTTPDVVADIIRRYKSGTSMRTIARDLNLDYRTVNTVLRKAEVEARSRRKARNLTAEMTRRYKSGDSAAVIAREIGVSAQTVSRALREAGVKMRSRSETTSLRWHPSPQAAPVVGDDPPA